MQADFFQFMYFNLQISSIHFFLEKNSSDQNLLKNLFSTNLENDETTFIFALINFIIRLRVKQ